MELNWSQGFQSAAGLRMTPPAGAASPSPLKLFGVAYTVCLQNFPSGQIINGVGELLTPQRVTAKLPGKGGCVPLFLFFTTAVTMLHPFREE